MNKQIIQMFKAWLSMVIIAKTFDTYPNKIRRILIKELGEEEFKAIREAKIAHNDHYQTKNYRKKYDKRNNN